MRHKISEFQGWHNVDEIASVNFFQDGDRLYVSNKPVWKTVWVKEWQVLRNDKKLRVWIEYVVPWMEEIQIAFGLEAGWFRKKGR